MSHPTFEPGQKPEGTDPVFYAEPPQKSRGCFFYGCIAALIVAGLGLLLVIAAVGVVWYYANRLIQDYTDTTPSALPTLTVTEEQRKSASERWDAFRKAIDEGKEAELVLTADDVNILIEKEPSLKGKVFCKINGEEVSGQISIPLGETGIPGLGGRYLNGSATFTAEIDDDGELDIRAREIEVKGKKLPPDVKAQLGGENLAKEFVKNPDNRRLVRKIKSIKIHDDKVFLKSRDMSKEKAEDDSDAPSVPAEPEPKKDAPSESTAAPKEESGKAEPAKVEAPKAEPTKVEAPKVEPAKEAPKPEPPKSEVPKAESPKADLVMSATHRFGRAA
ncbi:MAG: hypothetical protein U0794_20310 [Isosphaeraceae bacterium]